MRCFIYGLIGLIPVVGTGLAWQALRLCRSVSAELNDSWAPPALYLYWILGLEILFLVDRSVGLIGDLAVYILLCGAQSVHLWRSFLSAPQTVWNPARRSLLWGMVLAYAGFGGTVWFFGVLIFRLTRTDAL